MSNPLLTQKIGPALAAAAAEAFGGPAARPPQAPPVPVGNPEARAAFQAAMRLAEPAAPEPLGHAIFDTPATSSERAAKVARIRETLAGLARQIQGAKAELTADLEALTKESAAVKAAEQFDPKTASKFLADLHGVVTGLVPKDEPKQAE